MACSVPEREETKNVCVPCSPVSFSDEVNKVAFSEDVHVTLIDRSSSQVAMFVPADAVAGTWTAEFSSGTKPAAQRRSTRSARAKAKRVRSREKEKGNRAGWVRDIREECIEDRQSAGPEVVEVEVLGREEGGQSEEKEVEAEIVGSDEDWNGCVRYLNQDHSNAVSKPPSPFLSDRQEAVSIKTPPPSPAPATKPLLLTRSFIYQHLKELNERVHPVVERKEALLVYKRTLKAIESEEWLQRPLEEVWDQAQKRIVEGLFWAKQALSKELGIEEEEVGDEVQKQDRVWQAGEIPVNMDAPMLGQFLVAVNGFIQVKNEAQLANWFVLEPPFSDHYGRMIQELKQKYPKGNEDALEKKCSQALPAAREGEDGAPWTQFIKFMVQYLSYLREIDADPNKYLQTYDLLSELQVRVNSALTHATLGHLVLPVVVSCARLVCRLAIGLDKQPELIAHLKSTQPGGAAAGEDGGQRETLPERAANTLRTGFVTCLNDRTSGLNRTTGRPEGKKRGIYTIANLCLKILFQCRKTRNATQIFSNISNLSPPIDAYPKRERVTYLYYLGRFYWQNSHFFRAQAVLQRAYDEAPARPECVRQRRHILVYLVASNILLGRFPSEALLSRPEARGFAERFLPLCFAIRRGDLAAFRRHMDFDVEHAEWFLHFRILLQLRNRCEVLVWRSLIRKVFILAGTVPSLEGNSRAAPTVNIRDLVTAFTYLEKRAILDSHQQNGQGEGHIDPDFAHLDLPSDAETLLPDATALESILSSLIDQGLLGGFISHKQLKFAITGSKNKGGPLAAGFPNPWEVMRRKAEGEGQESNVPGWKREGAGAGGPGPGMVIHLSGAKPVGAFG